MPAPISAGEVLLSAPTIHIQIAMMDPPVTIMVLRPNRSVNSAMAIRVATNRMTPYTPVANREADEEDKPRDWKMTGL